MWLLKLRKHFELVIIYQLEWFQLPLKKHTQASDPISGNISEETPNTNPEEYTHPYIYCNIVYHSRDLETAQVPINACVDKKAVVHLHNGICYYSATKKKREILLFATAWMDLEIITLSEISQSEKDKYHMISIICGI